MLRAGDRMPEPSSLTELLDQATAGGIDVVAMFHKANRRVDAYTIQRADGDSLIAVQRLLSLKVDQITTDDPEGLAALLEANP